MRVAIAIAVAWLAFAIVTVDVVVSSTAHVDSVLWDAVAAAVTGH